MNYAYELKKCKQEFGFVDSIFNNYSDQFSDIDVEFIHTYGHISERCLDRDVKPSLIIKLVMYVLSMHKNKIFYNSIGGDICVNYKNDISIIIKHVVLNGRFQKKHTIRIATVLSKNQPTTNAKYFYVGIQEMIDFKLPKKIDTNYTKEFNYVECFNMAKDRLNSLIDSL